MTPDGDPLHSCAGVSAEELHTLLTLITDTDVTELDVTIGATRVSVRRSATLIATAPGASAADGPVGEPSSLAIASPLVGIFRPSVTAGDGVHKGEPIGVIEALGIPTTIDAPQSGTIEDVLAKNGDPVEYGQPLVILRRIPKEAASPWTPGGTDAAL